VDTNGVQRGPAVGLNCTAELARWHPKQTESAATVGLGAGFMIGAALVHGVGCATDLQHLSGQVVAWDLSPLRVVLGPDGVLVGRWGRRAAALKVLVL
jgi:hypothetical protein